MTRATGDLVIFVSDNQSWVDAAPSGGVTEVMKEWTTFKTRNPKARLVCIDIQPYAHTQAYPREDILNVGGFSDQVFEVVAAFADGRLRGHHWVDEIDAIEV
jgi:60 kDa SS-A/Ro ribonucleoprotein